MTRKPKSHDFRASSGNVFVDLRVPNADQELVRAELVKTICALVADKGLRQVDLAARLGISQPKVSLLMRGRTAGFSTEMLMRLLNRLGQRIDIVIKPARPGMIGETHVNRDAAALVEHRPPPYGARAATGIRRIAGSAGTPGPGPARGRSLKRK
jgi:predicted XRE-type DNA-binding protein